MGLPDSPADLGFFFFKAVSFDKSFVFLKNKYFLPYYEGDVILQLEQNLYSWQFSCIKKKGGEGANCQIIDAILKLSVVLSPLNPTDGLHQFSLRTNCLDVSLT